MPPEKQAGNTLRRTFSTMLDIYILSCEWSSAGSISVGGLLGEILILKQIGLTTGRLRMNKDRQGYGEKRTTGRREEEERVKGNSEILLGPCEWHCC